MVFDLYARNKHSVQEKIRVLTAQKNWDPLDLHAKDSSIGALHARLSNQCLISKADGSGNRLTLRVYAWAPRKKNDLVRHGIDKTWGAADVSIQGDDEVDDLEEYHPSKCPMIESVRVSSRHPRAIKPVVRSSTPAAAGNLSRLRLP